MRIRRSQPRSLQQQLVWPLLGLGLVIVLLSAWLASHVIRTELRTQALQRAQHLARTIQSSIEVLPSLETLQRLVTSMGADADIDFIVVTGGSPAQVLASTRLEWARLPAAYIEHPHLREELEKVSITRVLHEHVLEDTLGFTLPLAFQSEDPEDSAWQGGAVAVHLHAEPLYRRAMHKGMQVSAWVLLLVGGYLALAYLLLRRAMLGPLANICAAIKEKGPGPQPVPLPRKASSELSVLVDNLNQLLGSLSHSQAEAQRLALIVRHTDQGVALTDHDGRIQWINEGFRELSGYSQEELQGRTLCPIFHGEKTDNMPLADLQRAFQTGNHFDGEILSYRKDGRDFWLALQVQAVRDGQDRIQYFFAIAKDITERKQMEAALDAERALLTERVTERTAELTQANRELAKLSHLKSDFIASMSHELRTPLNAILGFSGSLLEQTYGTLSERQERSVRNIEKSGRHLLGIINDILDLSKIEAGKFVLRQTQTSLNEVCCASLEFVRPQAEKQKINLRLDIKEGIKSIYADERRLRQILVNLLSNAVKFTPAERWVGLEVWPEAKTREIVFCVWDNGPGISTAAQEALFQPFMQVDSSLTRKHEGTGLGLVLVRRFSELHGGRVWVESAEGQGSRFYVSLPQAGPT